jgi:hypothetical protein
MASLTSIRDGLKTALQSVTGLRAFDTIPDAIAPPAAIVGGPERIQWDLTFRRASDRYTIPVRIYVGRASERTAQDKLDGYLAGEGSGSIKEAIEADPTLGGAVETVRVTEARGYGIYPIGGVDYLGVEFLVDVIA